jgi:hypothetical protein
LKKINIFHYQGQEEDHYTHILMSMLEYKEKEILPQFLMGLVGEFATNFHFSNLTIHNRKKFCPQSKKEYELVIGIAPYLSGVTHNELEDNSGSIPDAWICGENFNLLFEFKIRGVLDEGQITAHKRLIDQENVQVMRLTWDHVMDSLKSIETKDEVLQFLLNNFLELKSKFISKRRSSGMPKEIISAVTKRNELHFVITGSKAYKPYKVELVINGLKEILRNDLSGITEARKFIAQYVEDHKETLPLEYKGAITEISDYCVAPGRAEKKNSWNQWRLGSYLK